MFTYQFENVAGQEVESPSTIALRVISSYLRPKTPRANAHYNFFIIPEQICSYLLSSSPNTFFCACFPSSLVTNFEIGFLEHKSTSVHQSISAISLHFHIAVSKVKPMRLHAQACGIDQIFTGFLRTPGKESIRHSHPNLGNSHCMSCQVCLGHPWVNHVEANFGSFIRHSCSDFSDCQQLHQFRNGIPIQVSLVDSVSVDKDITYPS